MKIAVLLSGGVDSSVALNLALREGAGEVTAFYLKIWLEDELAFLGQCPWEEDLKYARAVCEQAGVPLQVVPLQDEYQARIVSHVVDELRQGRTPSPDILCNQQIKFGLFLEKIGSDYQKVVTGHYAQIDFSQGRYRLQRSPDPVKDQTYFLSALSQEQLARLWFPIGHRHKHEVRALAEEMNLPNCGRRDSQGICFLGKIKYSDFVRFHLGEREGAIIDIETGRKLACHRGVWFHTVGQRKGLKLPGGPWYVVGKDVGSNELYVAHAVSYRRYARQHLVIGKVNWIAEAPGKGRFLTKLRHSSHLEPCEVAPLGDGRWQLTLQQPDQGVAPGQSAILYDGNTCLGGGVIEEDREFATRRGARYDENCGRQEALTNC